MALPPAFRFRQRLQEIGLFIQKQSPQHQAMRRLARRLKRARIPYAIMGAMAVNAHGSERTTKDVDVLLSRKGFERFRRVVVPNFYKKVEGRPRRFVEKASGVQLDVLVTGLYPGTGGPGPFAFPDSKQVRKEIDNIQVISLPQLIQLRLASRRYYDFGDVVFLIRVHDLDESFLEELHPSVHQDFIECLKEKRREDENEARQ
jgi:hypothetical protein